MEVRPLEIRIIKAHDLKDVNLMSKMDVYALVSISGDQLNNPKLKTAVDKDGGTSPKWNFSMKFTVDESAVTENRLTLKIKLISNRSLGDREIGVVYVQIKELFDNGGGGGGGDEEKSGSYSVRLANGTPKGTLDLAYKFGEKYKFEQPPPQPPPSSVKTVQAPPPSVKTADAPPAMAYPSAYPGSSSGYAPPLGAYPYHPAPQGAYQPPPPGYGYPPPGYAYGGYPAAAPPGYGYPPMQPPKKSGAGAGVGMGLGLGAGLIGGLLIGDMISDVGEMAAYDAGFDAGFGDADF